MANRGPLVEHGFALERDVVSIFASCVGRHDATAGSIDYDTQTFPFVVGDTVTQGTSNATGVIESDDGSTLVFNATTGTWDDSHVLTGALGVINFDAGTDPFIVGDTVTGGTSGKTGVIESVTYTAGPTSQGSMVCSSISGLFSDNEALTGAQGGAALVNGAANKGSATSTTTLTAVFLDPGTVKGKGVVSILAGGEGILNVTLADAWVGLLNVRKGIIDAGTVDDWEVTVVSETVATTKLLVLNLFKGGALTHPPSTLKLLLEIVLAGGKQIPSGV